MISARLTLSARYQTPSAISMITKAILNHGNHRLGLPDDSFGSELLAITIFLYRYLGVH